MMIIIIMALNRICMGMWNLYGLCILLPASTDSVLGLHKTQRLEWPPERISALKGRPCSPWTHCRGVAVSRHGDPFVFGLAKTVNISRLSLCVLRTTLPAVYFLATSGRPKFNESWYWLSELFLSKEYWRTITCWPGALPNDWVCFKFY
jgi:hypothetical protein